MDLWLIAATAATGYLAKCLQNVSKVEDNFPESSSEDISTVKSESPRCLVNRLMKVKKPKEESFEARKMINDGKKPDTQECDNAYGMEIPSTSGESLGNSKNIHSDSLFSLVPEFMENGDQNWAIHNFPVGDTQPYPFHDSFRNRTFLRRKQRYKRLIRPLNSLESCLMTQFHREQMAVEEYMVSPFPSPCAPITRPLLVTDGKRVISGNVGESLSGQIRNEDRIAHVRGIPPLTELESSVVSNKSRVANATVSRRRVQAHGLNDAALLLCIGISIGIMSSFIASKTKVNELKKALKQTENLVQDLQDELELKDSLIVRELENENTKNNDVDCIDDGERLCDQKAENSDSMSKIEAELEAELERLELNINTSNIKTRLSDMIDLDSDHEVDFVQGELRADRTVRQPFDETESNQDPSGNSTPESGNYAVSPRELSLRLHEVINSRLEERIKELEMALQKSQRKVEQLHMEAECKESSWARLWESHEVMRHETDREIPVAMDHTENNPAETEPLVMNLAGEALDAYNEAYDELMKLNDDSEEDDSPSEKHENGHQEEEPLMEKSSPWIQKNVIKDSSRTSEDMNFFRVQDLLDVVGLSEEEDEEISDLENEMEKQLIKQIVEKTKQGSPVVLNAQKMLFLMEEREQNL